jgi:hypothetical protein
VTDNYFALEAIGGYACNEIGDLKPPDSPWALAAGTARDELVLSFIHFSERGAAAPLE